MNDGGIIGVDRTPPGWRRVSWWQWALIGVAAIGVVIWIADKAVTTDTEAVASAFSDYSHAVSYGDGDRACELLTERGREETVKLAAVVLGGAAQPTCAAAVSATADRVPEELRSRASGIDPDDLGDLIDVNGDKATLTLDFITAREVVKLIKEGGSWRIESAVTAATPVLDAKNASTSDVIAGADALCRSAAQRGAIDLVDLLTASPGNPRRSAISSLRLSEGALLHGLTALGLAYRSAAVRSLIATERKVVASIKEVPSEVLRAPEIAQVARAMAPYRRAEIAVSEVAAKRGFGQNGCAARPQ